jgi:hypothetical protein
MVLQSFFKVNGERMKHKRRAAHILISLFCHLCIMLVVCMSVPAAAFAPPQMKAEEVLAKHLESIGTADARSSVRTRIISGGCKFSFHARSSGMTEGKVVIASEGLKTLLGMAFPSIEYPHERVGFDGKNLTTGYISPGIRTVLGNFLLTYNVIVREGLLGGTLTTAWPLTDVAGRKAKLEYAGTKTINGKETQALRYYPGKGSEVSIKLYFDSATFQHVRTEYERVINAEMGRTPEASSRQSASRYKMTEEFSDFKKEGGLILPHDYKLQLSIIGQSGSAQYEWDVKLGQFDFNQPIAPDSFNLEASKSST